MAGDDLAFLKAMRLQAKGRPYTEIADAIGKDTLVMCRFVPPVTSGKKPAAAELKLDRQIAHITAFFKKKKIATQQREKPYRGHIALYGDKGDKIFYAAPGIQKGEFRIAIEIHAKHFERLGTAAWEIMLSLVEHIAAANKRAMALDIPNDDRGPVYDPADKSWHFMPSRKH
jgi:mRNA-degrading endonuclease toxin of MazEF toxin-antitoxin module